MTAAAAMVCLSPGIAAPNVMAGYLGNTVVGTGNGIGTKAHYHADFTFDGSTTAQGHNVTFKGTWFLDPKGELCRVYADPRPAGISNPACQSIAAHKIGDTWTTLNGSYQRAMSLVAGIQ
jgi:hypothetical protein